PGGRATPGASLGGAGGGGPVPARGPAGVAVMGAAARVTSRGGDTRKVRPGAAVRDAGRDGRRGAAAEPGGDLDGRGEVAVAGGQGADPAGHRPGDHGRGGLVLGLADPPAVPRLDEALAAPVVPPPPRPFLPRLGGTAGGRLPPVLGVG